MKRDLVPVPATMKRWLSEIAHAYRDAREAVPYARVLGQPISEADVWLAAPDVALKFRGLARTKALRAKAANAATATFVASGAKQPSEGGDPYIAFAFFYIASHYGLALISALEADAVMDHVERNRVHLARRIEGQHGA